MDIISGIELIEEKEGVGDPAKKGDHVVYNVRIFLNKGDEVPINEQQAGLGLPAEIIRKVRVSPHLAYRREGIPGLIPADAVLVTHIWLREVRVGR